MARIRTLWLGIAVLAAVGISALALSGGSTAEAQTPEEGTLTVTGSAAVTVEPDGASIEITVSALENTAGRAQSAAAASMGRVRSALLAQGVEDADIQTVRISLFEEFDFGEEGRRRIGFRFSNTIRVTTDGVDAIGAVIDAAVTAGGDRVSINSIQFLVSNRAEAEDAARLAAIDDAQRKAEAMATRAGVSLGRVSVIEETGFSSPVAVEGPAFDEALAGTPVFGGSEQISASVRMIFRIS